MPLLILKLMAVFVAGGIFFRHNPWIFGEIFRDASSPKITELFLLLTLLLAFFHSWKVFKAPKSRPPNWFVLSVIALNLYLFQALSFRFDPTYSNLNLSALYASSFILALLSPLGRLPFFLFFLSQAFYIWLITVNVGFHPDISIFSPLLEVSIFFFALLVVQQKKIRGYSIHERGLVLIGINFLLGITYFFPALAKLKVSPHFFEWAAYNDVSNMLATSCNVGWPAACKILEKVGTSEAPFIVGQSCVLLMQLSSLFLIRGRIAALLCFFRILFHVAVLGLGGDSFAGLILLNGVLLVLNLRYSSTPLPKLDRRKGLSFAAAAVIVLCFNLSNDLGWFDTRVNQRYDVYLIQDDHKEVPVDYNFWGNYKSFFSLANLPFLTDPKTPVLDYGLGETEDYGQFLKIQDLDSFEEYQSKKNQLLKVGYESAEEKHRLLPFLRKYIQGRCRGGQDYEGPVLGALFPHYYLKKPTGMGAVSGCPPSVSGFRIKMAESFHKDGHFYRVADMLLYEERF